MTSGRGVTTAWAVSALGLFQAAPWACSPGIGLSLGQAACQWLSYPVSSGGGQEGSSAKRQPVHYPPTATLGTHRQLAVLPWEQAAVQGSPLH